MAEFTYPWTRFWCRRGDSVAVDPHGYLIDPAVDGQAINSRLQTLEQLSGKRCLILLGEPGIGKSRTIAAQVLATDRDSNECLHLDLYGVTEAILYRNLERGRFRRWLEGQGHLTLWIDSLDELLGACRSNPIRLT